METIKAGMENYVRFLEKFSDPLNVNMSVHLTLFLINFLLIYFILWGTTEKSQSKFRGIVHDSSGFISIFLAYFISAGFIWIKNN